MKSWSENFADRVGRRRDAARRRPCGFLGDDDGPISLSAAAERFGWAAIERVQSQRFEPQDTPFMRAATRRK